MPDFRYSHASVRLSTGRVGCCQWFRFQLTTRSLVEGSASSLGRSMVLLCALNAGLVVPTKPHGSGTTAPSSSARVLASRVRPREAGLRQGVAHVAGEADDEVVLA